MLFEVDPCYLRYFNNGCKSSESVLSYSQDFRDVWTYLFAACLLIFKTSYVTLTEAANDKAETKSTSLEVPWQIKKNKQNMHFISTHTQTLRNTLYRHRRAFVKFRTETLRSTNHDLIPSSVQFNQDSPYQWLPVRWSLHFQFFLSKVFSVTPFKFTLQYRLFSKFLHRSLSMHITFASLSSITLNFYEFPVSV